MSQLIHIAASCDANYVPHVATAFASAIDNTASPERLCFHLISCQIPTKHTDLLTSMVEDAGASLNLIEASDSKFTHLPTLRYGTAAYQRIALAEYLAPSIDRVIYLDSDTVVIDDIDTLWAIDIQGAPLAAIENLSPKACQDFGFKRQDYFNSGVLLIDLAQWRARDIRAEATAFINHNKERLRFIDQCALNGIFSKQWYKLPLRWNQQADIYGVLKKYSEGCGYDANEITQAIVNPAIVHFIGTQKPWTLKCFHPFQKHYQHYLQKTPWVGKAPTDFTVMNMIKRFLSIQKHIKQSQRYHALVRKLP